MYSLVIGDSLPKGISFWTDGKIALVNIINRILNYELYLKRLLVKFLYLFDNESSILILLERSTFLGLLCNMRQIQGSISIKLYCYCAAGTSGILFSYATSK